MLDLPLSGIKRIEAIAQSSNEYISLSQGALRVGGIPTQIKQYVQFVLNTDKSDYYQSAWGIMLLREKIASVLSENLLKDCRSYGSTGSPRTVNLSKKKPFALSLSKGANERIKITPNQVLITHGCIGALSTLFFTVLGQGDEVIVPEPTYPAYEKLTRLAYCKPVFVSCVKNEPNSTKSSLWELNLEKIKSVTTPKTKIIVFSNPWNPLGITISRDIILQLLEWCEKNKIYLVIDEAYKDYCFDGSFKSCIDLVNSSEFLIQVSSFSKNMAMSGWRVGYIVAPEKLIRPLGKVQDALLNCPNVLAQYAALYALDHPEFTQNFYNIVKNSLEFTLNLISPLIKEKIFSYQKPSGSFFLFLKTQQQDSTDLCMNILNRAKVALVPGKFFGKSGVSFLRLCYARNPEVLQEGIDRLIKYF